MPASAALRCASTASTRRWLSSLGRMSCEELFRFHLARVRELGGYLCGRRLYETMLVWETDPPLRDNELGAAFADVWCAIRYPVVIGGGHAGSCRRSPNISLELIETRTFGSRVIHERYRRAPDCSGSAKGLVRRA